MRIVTVIQTRRGSSRLPDKVLLPLAGKPLFVRQAERVKAARLSGHVVIATTTMPGDDAIADVCEQEGLDCYRGDALDLLDRHYQAGLLYHADVVIKIPSDCPLIDPVVIDQVIEFYQEHKDTYDFVSNLHPASWPDGNDVEIMPMPVLTEAWKEAVRPLEREYTTPFIWERPDRYRVGNVAMDNGKDYSMSHRFTIDYAKDYTFMKTVFEELYPANPMFGVDDILWLLERRPDIYELNAEYAGVNWYRLHLDELKTVNANQTKQL